MSQDEPSTRDPLKHELEAAREEAALTLEQLHLVQEELEIYFLKAEKLAEDLAERDQHLDQSRKQVEELRQQLDQAGSVASDTEALRSQHAAELAQRDQMLAERNQLLSDQEQILTQLRHDLEQSRQSGEQQAQRIAERDQQLQQRDLQLAEQTQTLDQRQHRVAELERECGELREQLSDLQRVRDQWAERANESQGLLQTAQKMLEGQAAYLQDLSRKEEEAELALERQRLFEAEILYYFLNSQPASELDPERIPRIRSLLQQRSAASRGSRGKAKASPAV